MNTKLTQSAGPILAFLATLTVLLGLSSAMILPAMVTLEVGGQKVDARTLAPTVLQLEHEIEELRSKREATLFPAKTLPHRRLMEEKLSSVRMEYTLADLQRLIREIDPRETAVVHFDTLSLDPLTATMILKGDIRNVGPACITTLVQFLTALKSAPWIMSVSPQSFSRIDDEKIGAHSPFDLTLTLQ